MGQSLPGQPAGLDDRALSSCTLTRVGVIEPCTPEQYQAYLDTFTKPDPARRSLIEGGRVGLLVLSPCEFQYSPDLGYDFALAAKAEESTGRRLLFIRISSWDPHDPRSRASGWPVDFCIPLAYEEASPRERLTWSLGFGGAWSDSREEALLVFTHDWAEWFRGLAEGVAFTNPDQPTACLLRFGKSERKVIEVFCG